MRVAVQAPGERLPRERQLAWQIAGVATARPPRDAAAEAMVGNRLIDNAAVALAAISNRPPATARAQALAHPRPGGATLVGLGAAAPVQAAWAAWANGTAVRELDFHDTFLAADYSHPGDTIPPILAVAQQLGCAGDALVRGILVGYEVQVALVKAICLHAHKIDHILHLAPAQAAGIGALLDLERETIFQAVNQAVHTAIGTRQSRKGEISSWKAFAPAHAGKLAIAAVDRAMRGEGAPAPIYEGTDGVIAWLLDGPEAVYDVPLPDGNAPYRAILETYTKEHAAEYQAQAPIDLARRLHSRIADTEHIHEIVLYTSHHTHTVIGTGSGDPEKFDPQASRETLDHSLMYIFAVALQDGTWDHARAYTPDRAQRPDTVRLWHKIRTAEDPAWTRRYHATDPREKAYGCRAEIIFVDGTRLVDELAVADAHPLGARPFDRPAYIGKFDRLTAGAITADERARFLALTEAPAGLTAAQVAGLTPCLPAGAVTPDRPTGEGLF